MFMRRAHKIVQNGIRDIDYRGLTPEAIDGLAYDIMRAATSTRRWDKVGDALVRLRESRAISDSLSAGGAR